jgi:predicted enzyme related to lactoylglutathione lyase
VLGEAAVIGFVPVRDLRTAEAFYGGVLGLEVLGNDGFALVLRGGNGTMIRCVSMPEVEPQPFTIMGWEVPEIQAAVRRLRSSGVALKRYPQFQQDEDAVWTAPDGSRVAWFSDPSGNVLSLSQPAGQDEGAGR